MLSCDVSSDDKYIVTGSGDKKATVYEVIYWGISPNTGNKLKFKKWNIIDTTPPTPYPHFPRPIIRNFCLFSLSSSFHSSDRDKLTRARYDNRATPKSLVKSSSCHENFGLDTFAGEGKKTLYCETPSSIKSPCGARVGVSVFLFFTIVERCSLFNSIMCVCVRVCMCVYTLPSVYGPFFVLYTSIIHYTQCLWSKYNCVQKKEKRKCVWFAGLLPQQL